MGCFLGELRYFGINVPYTRFLFQLLFRGGKLTQGDTGVRRIVVGILFGLS